MISENQITYLSKLLSYILRHEPEEYEIVLDENGYTNVDELINKLNAHNENISFEILHHIVDTNNKKRFALNDDLDSANNTLMQASIKLNFVSLLK